MVNQFKAGSAVSQAQWVSVLRRASREQLFKGGLHRVGGSEGSSGEPKAVHTPVTCPTDQTRGLFLHICIKVRPSVQGTPARSVRVEADGAPPMCRSMGGRWTAAHGTSRSRQVMSQPCLSKRPLWLHKSHRLRPWTRSLWDPSRMGPMQDQRGPRPTPRRTMECCTSGTWTRERRGYVISHSLAYWRVK
jgi:hypothetical protein